MICTLSEMAKQFDKKLVANNLEVKKYEKLGGEKVRAVEEILKQTEEDADKEILDIKSKYEKILKGVIFLCQKIYKICFSPNFDNIFTIPSSIRNFCF